MDGRTGGQTDRARAEKEDRGRRGLFIGWSDTRDRLMLLALRCCVSINDGHVSRMHQTDSSYSHHRIFARLFANLPISRKWLAGNQERSSHMQLGTFVFDMKGEKEFKPAVIGAHRHQCRMCA